ncbi:AAA family ATPase [Aquipuribacter sp. SD81]|uniref:AAA family ATPase n=1 Tax=Aquipuribacter sp. SD81 TaxID=3127703 RepID=UPI003018D907
MRLLVLGSTRVPGPSGDGGAAAAPVGARKPRALLAALAMTPGRPVSLDALADLVWDGAPPRAVRSAVHAYVSGLRTVLRGSAADGGAAIVTTDHGYVLDVAPDEVDAHAFAREVDDCLRVLDPLPARLPGGAGPPLPGRDVVLGTVERLEAVDAWWGGTPYADLPAHLDVEQERAGLERRRAEGRLARATALLATGDASGALAWTADATAEQPLSEQVWALHALALYRSGRQVEALDALRTLREALADQLGLDPTPRVQDLERRVLRQEAALLVPLLPPPPVAAPAPPAPPARQSEPASAPSSEVPGEPSGEAPGDLPSGPSSEPSSEPASVPGPPALVGRAEEQAALSGLLDAALAGRTAVGVVVGEPGIGKSALLGDLAAAARARGVTVATGRCSQDDGAPPLWPFLQVLRDLGAGAASPLELVPTGDAPAFGTWERVARGVLDAAAERPVLLVLDDLHWADEATHRALAHLLGSAPDDARLALVVSRRAHPEPSGTLALAADALARRQSVRLDLRGLGVAAAAELVRPLAHADVPDGEVAAWHQRCGGNPFYLAELARVTATGGSADAVPGGVLDVVRRRLGDLPEVTQELLRTAAVVGRSFGSALVAAASDAEEDAAEDALAVAVAQGLVAETGTGTWAFAHALTRDAVLRTLGASQQARRHARLARLLEEADARYVEPDERTTELARHWTAAGPSHADRAWPAARAAADQARALSAHLEAFKWREAAVAAQRRSSRSDPIDRYRLLLDLAQDAALAAVWPPVVEACTEAVAIARGVGDPELAATAAAGLNRYALWTPQEWDVVDGPTCSRTCAGRSRRCRAATAPRGAASCSPSRCSCTTTEGPRRSAPPSSRRVSRPPVASTTPGCCGGRTGPPGTRRGSRRASTSSSGTPRRPCARRSGRATPPRSRWRHSLSPATGWSARGPTGGRSSPSAPTPSPAATGCPTCAWRATSSSRTSRRCAATPRPCRSR